MTEGVVSLLDESMALLAENQRRLRVEMDASVSFSVEHSSSAQKLARSAAALGAEVRKARAAAEDDAAATTDEGKDAAALAWLRGRPREVLAPIVGELHRLVKPVRSRR